MADNSFGILPNQWRNEKGAMLIVVIWLLVILSFMALSFNRHMSIELKLTKYAMNKLKAKYIAMGGLHYVLAKIDSKAKDLPDTLWQCGVKLNEHQYPSDIFREVSVNGGHFTVGYNRLADSSDDFIYGLADEERKINLNAMIPQDYRAFKELLVVLGVNDTTARTIAASTVDWIDEDNAITDPPYGEEGDEYQTSEPPYLCKNRPFDNIEELLLVKGVNQDILEKVKFFLTVVPLKPSRLGVNFNTAFMEVLQALARSETGPRTNTSITSADSLVLKIVNFRKGEDGIEGTKDDRLVEGENMGLNSEEMAIFLTMAQFNVFSSQYLHAQIFGIDSQSGISATIKAIIDRNDLSVLLWEAN
jgi:general secretion pathway protein K